MIAKLNDAHPNIFATTVSHTTRAPRVGEIEGETYFYVSTSAFTTLIGQDAFVEHALFSGNHYGTSNRTIADQMAKGLVVLLDIEMEGIKQMKSKPSIDARYVFIKPPSFEALETRLKKRSTDNESSVQKRLAQAKLELEYADTPGVHDKIIVNDDLQRAYEELDGFIYKEASQVNIASTKAEKAIS